MNRCNLAVRIALGALALGGAMSAEATVITDWDFGPVAATSPDNTPAPTSGTGSATSLGMTNTYDSISSTTADDIVKDTSSAQVNNDVWRIRGTGSGSANGWSTAAPQYSQGAQFNVSTLGYTGVTLSFSWASTSNGIANMQVQYNTNVNNSAGWTDVGSLLNATVGNGAPCCTYQTDTINFAALGITSADQDPNFGVRLVSAYNPTLAAYATASSVIAGSPADYVNGSGNWRFADVQVDGTVAPVPLPAAAWLLVSGLGGLAAFRRRRAAPLEVASGAG